MSCCSCTRQARDEQYSNTTRYKYDYMKRCNVVPNRNNQRSQSLRRRIVHNSSFRSDRVHPEIRTESPHWGHQFPSNQAGVLYGVENLYTLSFNIIRQLSLLDNLTVNTVEISQWQLATNCMYIDQKVPKTMNVEVMRLWRYLVVQKPTSRRDELSQQLSSGLLCVERDVKLLTHSL